MFSPLRDYYGDQYTEIIEGAKRVLRQGGNAKSVEEFVLSKDKHPDKGEGSSAVCLARYIAQRYMPDPPQMPNNAALRTDRFATAEQVEEILSELIVRDGKIRDPLKEPPCYEDYLGIVMPAPHPRANQYPSTYTFGEVLYAEDPFWTKRTVPIPEGTYVPTKPKDYWNVERSTPPPEWINETYNPLANDVSRLAARFQYANWGSEGVIRRREREQRYLADLDHTIDIWFGAEDPLA